MDTLDPRKKITGIFSRRRILALSSAGVLSIGLGIGAVSGAFAAPPSQPALAAVTPVASPAASSTANPSGGHLWRGPGEFLGPVATFLGISQADLRTALTNNQTLAQVAVAHGKTAADLKAFLLNRESAEIDHLINNPLPQPGARGPGGPGRPRGPASTSPNPTPTATATSG